MGFALHQRPRRVVGAGARRSPLAGYRVHLQSWVLDPPANGLGVIASNGGTATLGF